MTRTANAQITGSGIAPVRIELVYDSVEQALDLTDAELQKVEDEYYEDE